MATINTTQLAAEVYDLVAALHAETITEGAFKADLKTAFDNWVGLSSSNAVLGQRVVSLLARIDGMILNAGVPPAELGEVGAFAFDTENKAFYGPKTEDGWGNPEAVLQGDTGATGADGADGADGAEVELQVTATHIQWRLTGAVSWTNLIALSALKGDTGATGAKGDKGDTGDQGEGLQIDAVGDFADRSTHDAASPGFVFLAEDQGSLYVRLDPTGWSGAQTFTQGADGADGAAARDPEFQSTATHVQWRLTGDVSWTNLFPISGDEILPLGHVGFFALAPSGDWMEAQGQILLPGEGGSLRQALIDASFPFGSDSGNPKLPDIGARVIAGREVSASRLTNTALDGTVQNPSGATVGSTGGADRRSLRFVASRGPTNNGPTGTVWTTLDGVAIEEGAMSSGSKQSSNVQPTIVMYAYIRTEPANAGAQGPQGDDGREVQLQMSATHVQWRYAGVVDWTDLVALSEITGPTGAAGADGADGNDGTNGADGLSVLNGTGAPVSGVGADGDFYVDTTGWDIYGPKTTGSWGSGTSLVGPQGATGADGSDGANGADGDSAYAVAVAEGFVGDEAAWLLSLKGEKGDDGNTGATGAAGFAQAEPTLQTSNFTAVAGKVYSCSSTAGAFTSTLPPSPSPGAMVRFIDATWNFGTAALTLDRNGEPINGVAENFEADVNGVEVTATYINGTRGWNITASAPLAEAV